MSSPAEAYAELIDAALSRSSHADLELGRLRLREREALERRYALEPHVRSIFFERYPHAGIRLPYRYGPADYEGSMVLPSVAWLLRHAQGGRDWPRDWFPLAVTDDHFVQFLLRGAGNVRAIYTDSDFDRQGYIPPTRDEYTSLAAFLRAAAISLRYLRPDAFESKVAGRWPWRREVRVLRPAVAKAIRTRWSRHEEGPALLPQTGVLIEGE